VEYSRREQTAEMFESKDFYNLNKHLFARFEFGPAENRQSLILLNLHLKSGADSEATRIRQGRLAHHWLRSQIVAGENVVVLGDLNTENGIDVPATANNDIGVIRGLYSPDSSDDLVDLHQHLDENLRTTHIANKQLDRILISPSLSVDTPGLVDLVYNRIVTRRDLVIGSAADEIEQHFNDYYKIPRESRDVSDHYPIMAEFLFK
jgi:endonuclease/exonuclease/phosphatase family metal-dependent hydrolase